MVDLNIDDMLTENPTGECSKNIKSFNHTPRGATKLGIEDYGLVHKKQDCDTVVKGNPNGTKRFTVDKIMQCLPSRVWTQFVNKPGTKNIQNKLREIDLFKLAEHATIDAVSPGSSLGRELPKTLLVKSPVLSDTA